MQIAKYICGCGSVYIPHIEILLDLNFGAPEIKAFCIIDYIIDL